MKSREHSAAPLHYPENFQKTKRPVVPVIAGIIVVDIRQTAIVRVAAMETIVAVIQILSASAQIH